MNQAILKPLRFIYLLIIIVLLASCQNPAGRLQDTKTQVLPAETSLPPTSTKTPNPATTPTLTPSAIKTVTATSSPSLTPMKVIPIKSGPLTLDVTNAGTKMQRLARLGFGHAEEVEFSPDGKYLAVGSGAGIVLYDAKTFELVRLIETNSSTGGIAFSPDGSYVATRSVHGLGLWSIESGHMIREITPEHVSSMMDHWIFSKSGFIAISGRGSDNNYWVEVLSATTGKTIFSRSFGDIWIFTFDISPDGKTLYYAEGDGGKLVDINSGKMIDLIPKGNAFLFSPDGSGLFIAGNSQQDALLWDLKKRKSTSLPELKGCETFSRNGNGVYCYYGPRTILIIDPTNGSVLKKLFGYSYSRASISADGQYLAYYDENAAYILDTNLDEVVKTLPFETTTSLAIGLVQTSGSVQYLAATGTMNGLILLWDISTGKQTGTLAANERAIQGLAFGPDQRTLASLDDVGQIRLWDLQSMKTTASYDAGDSGYSGWRMSFDTQGQKLISFSQRIFRKGGGLILNLQEGMFNELSTDFWAFLFSNNGIYGIKYIPEMYKDNIFSIGVLNQASSIEFNIPYSPSIGFLDASAISPDERDASRPNVTLGVSLHQDQMLP